MLKYDWYSGTESMISMTSRSILYKQAENYNSILSNYTLAKESIVVSQDTDPKSVPGSTLTPTAALQARVRTLCPSIRSSHVAPFCTYLKKKKVATDSDILTEALTWTPPSKVKATAAVVKPAAIKKVAIPKHVKTLVWDKYIGADKAEAPCVSCRSKTISIRNFHCGHVLAEANGGDSTIQNLRPICAPCNLSMGKRSMNEFTKEFFGWVV